MTEVVATERAGRAPATLILSACLFLTGISAAAVAPYRAIVAVDGLGMSNGAYALVIVLGSIGGAIASPLLGWLADKAPDRRLLVIGCAVLGGIGYGLIYLLPSVVTYVAVFCLILPFGGALFSQSLSYARSYFDLRQPKRAEFMISVLRTLFSLAWVVAPPIVGWIASGYSVFGVFAAAALAHVAYLICFGALFADPGSKIGTASKGRAAVAAESRLPARRIAGIGGVTLVRIAIILHLTTLPLVLTKDFHGSLGDVAINASLAAALEVPFMLLWGFAATRLTKEVVLVGNALLYGAYLILVFCAHSVQQVLWLQGLNAVATAALVSVTISYMQESIKGRVGLSTSLMDVVTVVSTLAAAGLFALFSSAQSYTVVLLAGGVFSVAGAAVIAGSVLVGRRPPHIQGD